ncbi:hypothetical protein FVE85_9465 [Porphyridium purpureum]|uniref:Sec-independent protein translocase protein TatA n=1 Tax=Porphyridium purpureum TaxID=35688 RepID=A0A5J4YJX7_PORPP|nr:hypothetical protein FVE85_9465 [Porphyridium purpureum]|eukprot:POR3590..scf261_15
MHERGIVFDARQASASGSCARYVRAGYVWNGTGNAVRRGFEGNRDAHCTCFVSGLGTAHVLRQTVGSRRRRARAPRTTLSMVTLGPGGGFLGVGPAEVVTILVVGWIVLGPKELINVSRQVGTLVGQVTKNITEAAQAFIDEEPSKETPAKDKPESRREDDDEDWNSEPREKRGTPDIRMNDVRADLDFKGDMPEFLDDGGAMAIDEETGELVPLDEDARRALLGLETERARIEQQIRLRKLDQEYERIKTQKLKSSATEKPQEGSLSASRVPHDTEQS